MSKKVLLDSDKMTWEEYNQEDFSRMRNLVADYQRCRTDGVLLYDYQERLQEMIDEIIRDPRNYTLVPKFLKGEYHRYSTPEETFFFYDQLKKQTDPIDMRNKLERMMEKPPAEVTRSEQEAFHHFVLIKGLPQVDGPESIQPDVYFHVHDKVFRGHRAIREMDAEKAKFNGQVPESFERAYQQKLADIVIVAPQIFTELPKSITDVEKPNNVFFDRLVERKEDVRKLKETVDEKRLSGEEVTKEDLFKENLYKSLETYRENTEKFAEAELARIEAQLDSLLKDERNIEGGDIPQPLDSFEELTPEQMKYYARGGMEEDQQAIEDYYKNLTLDDRNAPPVSEDVIGIEDFDEDIYFSPTLDEMNLGNLPPSDDAPFVSLEKIFDPDYTNEAENLDIYQDYIFDATKYNSIDIDDYDGDHIGAFSQGLDSDLQKLIDEWYQLNNKDKLKRHELDKMVDLESQMGFKVAQDQSNYMSIPSEVVNTTKGNSPFFNELLKNIKDEPIDPILDSDLSEYKIANSRWKTYVSEEKETVKNNKNNEQKGTER